MVLNHRGTLLPLLQVHRASRIPPAFEKLDNTGHDEARARSEHRSFILPPNEESAWGGGLL